MENQHFSFAPINTPAPPRKRPPPQWTGGLLLLTLTLLTSCTIQIIQTNTIMVQKKKTRIIRNQFNYEQGKHSYEHLTGPSMTQPGEAYTIRELLDKFTTGIDPQVGRELYYDEDAQFESDVRMRQPDYDLTDGDNIISENEMKIKTLTKKIEDRKRRNTPSKEDNDNEAITKKKIVKNENEVKETDESLSEK